MLLNKKTPRKSNKKSGKKQTKEDNWMYSKIKYSN
jgi:hypothetical protein